MMYALGKFIARMKFDTVDYGTCGEGEVAMIHYVAHIPPDANIVNKTV